MNTLLPTMFQTVFVLLVAPLFTGWVNQCRSWLQNRSSPGLLQPYRVLRKLFYKEAVLAHRASALFRAAPYVRFGCMLVAAGIVPTLVTGLPVSAAADVIVLVGIFALARVFMALAAMDVGTAFGTLGARREMFIAFLAEPALLMVFFTPALIAHSTSLSTIVRALSERTLVIYPSLAFAAVAFVMVLLAENARIPIDNPATHLELTMVHEAMMLEYSGRYLALMDWSSSLKLLSYCTIGIALFLPWGIGHDAGEGTVVIAMGWLVMKLAVAGAGLAVLETLSAKLRLFRAPEFLAMAFLLAVLAMLTRTLLEGVP